MTEKKKNKTNESKKKILYIIISIIASVSLWSYVTYVDNPDMPLTKSNISVEYVGADVLKENNLVVTSTDTDTLTLTFSGKRNTVMRLDDAFITATVDLSDIVEMYSATAGVYQLEYDLDYGGAVSQSAVSIANTSKNYVTVTVEKLASERVPVQVKNNVKTAEGFIAEQEVLSVRTVVVTGPQSEVSKIDHALVEITREDISKPLEEDVPVALIDGYGNPVTSTSLTTDVTAITVSIPVLMVKEVPLTVEYIDASAVKGNDATTVITPKFITLAGEPEDLENMDKLVIGSVDLSTFAIETVKHYNIEIPAGLKNVSGEITAKAETKLPNHRVKMINVSDIQIRGVPSGKKATLSNNVLQVSVRGLVDNLTKVTSANVRVVVDVPANSADSGTVTATAKVYLENTVGIDVVGEYKVDISISEE